MSLSKSFLIRTGLIFDNCLNWKKKTGFDNTFHLFVKSSVPSCTKIVSLITFHLYLYASVFPCLCRFVIVTCQPIVLLVLQPYSMILWLYCTILIKIMEFSITKRLSAFRFYIKTMRLIMLMGGITFHVRTLFWMAFFPWINKTII